MINLVCAYTTTRSHRHKPCQDAAAVNLRAGRFAVADGVGGNSCLQGEFAAFLCHAFVSPSSVERDRLFEGCNGAGPAAQRAALLRAWGATLAASWATYVEPFLADRETRSAWTREKTKAMAMFAGIEIAPGRDGYRAGLLAAGDAFIFLIDDRTGACGDVITNAPGPDGLPQSVAVGAADPEVFFGTRVKMKTLPLPPKCRLLLATDALGRWIQTAMRHDPRALLKEIDALDSQPAFNRWIATHQASGALEEDDVALVALAIDGDGGP